MAERDTATDRRKALSQLEAELESARPVAGKPQSDPRHDDDLARCPCCGLDLVQPIDWAPAGRGYWSVMLRCPDCEWRGGGTYGQEAVDRFDEALDDGVQLLLDDLELLSRANAEERIDRFAAALEADLILPEDF